MVRGILAAQDSTGQWLWLHDEVVLCHGISCMLLCSAACWWQLPKVKQAEVVGRAIQLHGASSRLTLGWVRHSELAQRLLLPLCLVGDLRVKDTVQAGPNQLWQSSA